MKNESAMASNKVGILFFGSNDDSVIVANRLLAMNEERITIDFFAVVTQPARPVGRKQVLTPTPVEVWAKAHKFTFLSFPSNPDKPWLYADEKIVIDTLDTLKPDLIVSASYGQKIPTPTLKSAKFGGLNVHPSVLPRWRGADPVPWAILSGDAQTGVTITTLEEKFDQGKIIAQKNIPMTDRDTSNPLRTKLFTLGADLLAEVLPDYLSGKIKGVAQDPAKATYARKLVREDGFEKWQALNAAINEGRDAERLERKFRALTPWPGLWTKVKVNNEEKRLKILSLHLSSNNVAIQQFNNLVLDSVQLEGKNPVSFIQFSKAYTLS